MASELTVQTIRGPLSGADANKIIIPTGQSLSIADGVNIDDIPAGTVIQKQVTNNMDPVNFQSQSWQTIFQETFTPKRLNSDIIVYMNVAIGTRSTGELQFGHRIVKDGTTSITLTSDSSSTYDIYRHPATDGLGHFHIQYIGKETGITDLNQRTYNFDFNVPSASYASVYFNFSGRTGTVFTIEEIAR